MGLFDLFSAPPPSPSRSPCRRRRTAVPTDRSRMFDVARTGELARLFALPRDQRDADWYRLFWTPPGAPRSLWPSHDTFSAPTGCLSALRYPSPGPFDSQSFANLAGDCLRDGVGAAFFASPDDPPRRRNCDSMGLIDHLVRYDCARRRSGSTSPTPRRARTRISLQPAAAGGMHGGSRRRARCSSARLRATSPVLRRGGFVRHLEQNWGMKDPRVQLLADMSLRPHRNLVIGRKRSEFAPTRRSTKWPAP